MLKMNNQSQVGLKRRGNMIKVSVSDMKKRIEESFIKNKAYLRDSGNTAWTDFFLDIFSDQELLPGAEDAVCHARHETTVKPFNGIKPREPKCINEFIWDLCWFPEWEFKPDTYYLEKLEHSKLPLVLESEWSRKNAHEVFYDFTKLLYAKAEVKVMIFEFNDKHCSFESFSDQMAKSVKNLDDTAEYLLVGVKFSWEGNEKDEDLLKFCTITGTLIKR
jgi:hypothetical protein